MTNPYRINERSGPKSRPRFYEQEDFDTVTHWTVVKKFDFLISPNNQEIQETGSKHICESMHEKEWQ